MYYLKMLGISWLLTEIIECALSLILIRKSMWKDGFPVIFLMNLLTNPPVVFLYDLSAHFISGTAALFGIQLLLEVLAVLSEGKILSAFRNEEGLFKHPYRISLILNAVSYGIGLIIGKIG